MPMSSYAAGALVALCGKSEGGKTLSRSTVEAVMGDLGSFFDPSSYRHAYPIAKVLPSAQRVATMSISDANKKHMIQHIGFIEMLLECLIIDNDNRRKDNDGANDMQELSAGVLHELSLYGPTATALRSHRAAIPALRKLCEVGTKLSKERGAAALFELDEDTRQEATTGSENTGAGTGLLTKGPKLPPHVMASYNWDHQDTILRVVSSLQHRGYLVWVDTEQMKGATVDTMALAVEGSAVVLIGVSRAYKESSNCRMEAQYALQKKKALIPLMLVHGYEADGWLGLLLGTSMWYGFYDEALSSSSAFEGRVDALCREIGDRGRADSLADAASIASSSVPTVTVHNVSDEGPADEVLSGLQLELREMKLMALHRRALSASVNSESVDDAMESADPKAVLISLIVNAESRRGPDDRMRLCLETGGEACAKMVTGVLEHAMDVIEQQSMSSPRKSRKAMRELLENIEELSESIDAQWCDGVSRCSSDRLEILSSSLLGVRGLVSDESDASATVSTMSSLLEALRKCGSVAVQCSSVLRVGSGVDDAVRMSVLESVCALSVLRLNRVDEY